MLIFHTNLTLFWKVLGEALTRMSLVATVNDHTCWEDLIANSELSSTEKRQLEHD